MEEPGYESRQFGSRVCTFSHKANSHKAKSTASCGQFDDLSIMVEIMQGLVGFWTFYNNVGKPVKSFRLGILMAWDLERLSCLLCDF